MGRKKPEGKLYHCMGNGTNTLKTEESWDWLSKSDLKCETESINSR